MSIKLNGSSAGSVSFDAPADTSPTGTDVTLTLPTSAGSAGQVLRNGSTAGTLEFGGGNILQVVEGNTSTEVVVSTTTYTDTGLSATITPISATSKVLVIVNQQAQYSRAGSFQGMGLNVLRDSTTIYTSVSSASGEPYLYFSTNTGGSVNTYQMITITLLDSPNTTSAITYKTQGRPYVTTDSGSTTFQNAGTGSNGYSQVILMEVAG